jgi:hypothetical protein
MKNVEPGDRVRDRVSGLEGVVTGRAEFLFGGAQVLLTPGELKDGKPIEGTWLEEGRVTVVSRAIQIGAGWPAYPRWNPPEPRNWKAKDEEAKQ